MPDIKYLCLDVANGYSEHFVAFVSDIRKQFPSQTIMVSDEVISAILPSCNANIMLHMKLHKLFYVSGPYPPAWFIFAE